MPSRHLCLKILQAHRSHVDDRPSVISTLHNVEIRMAMECITFRNVAGVAALVGLCCQACKVGSGGCQIAICRERQEQPSFGVALAFLRVAFAAPEAFLALAAFFLARGIRKIDYSSVTPAGNAVSKCNIALSCYYLQTQAPTFPLLLTCLAQYEKLGANKPEVSTHTSNLYCTAMCNPQRLVQRFHSIEIDAIQWPNPNIGRFSKSVYS